MRLVFVLRGKNKMNNQNKTKKQSFIKQFVKRIKIQNGGCKVQALR